MKAQTLFIISIVFLVALSGCVIDLPISVDEFQGSGVIVTEERAVENFDRLSLGGFGSVTIRQGEEEFLSITTDDNILPLIKTDVQNGNLTLEFSRNGRDWVFQPTDGIDVELVVTDLARINLSGAWKVDVESLNTEELRVDLSGAGDVQINSLVADELVVRQTGAGSIVASGQVSGQEVSMSGAGTYFAAELESETAILDITGIGTATVWVTETLDVQITSVGNVIYYGSPRVIESVTGLGELISQGNK